MKSVGGWVRFLLGTAAAGLLLAAVACGSGRSSSSPNPTNKITVSLPSSTVNVPQDGTPVIVSIAISSPSETAVVSIAGMPGGVQQTYAASDTSPSGQITFVASSSAPAGTYAPTITVNSAGQTASLQFTLIVDVVAKVGSSIDTTLGAKGNLQQFMSTSFQISQYTGNPFSTGATTAVREATLNNLEPQHIRLQAVEQAVPMVSNTGTASDWDFTLLDQTVQPVLASADHSPEFQIAVAPAWMCNSNGYFDIADHLGDFATYAANLVRYYNTGGFDVNGTHFQSPSSQPIQWWGVFNEFNIQGLTTAQYVQLYDTVVPAMLAVDPTIKLSALELSDYGLGTGEMGDPMLYLPAFFAAPSAGGVNAQVNIVSTHLYGTCHQTDMDTTVFAGVAQFVDNLNYFYSQLQSRSDLGNVKVWITENNVNSDYANSLGISSCDSSVHFVADPRNKSAFFAAWRPYEFSQLGKAGNQALYQWQYPDGEEFGETDLSGNTNLSYWVDRALAAFYPFTATSPGQDILSLTATDTSSVETLATRNSNGTVLAMVVDRAVHASSDNNGSGDPRTVVVDTSRLGVFSAASVLTIDATTNVANGPSGIGVTPASRIPVTLNGYGVAFLTLTP